MTSLAVLEARSGLWLVSPEGTRHDLCVDMDTGNVFDPDTSCVMSLPCFKAQYHPEDRPDVVTFRFAQNIAFTKKQHLNEETNK